MKTAEAKLRDFAKKNNVAAPEAQRSNLALQAADSVGLMHLAEQSIAADEERVKADKEQMATTASTLDHAAILGNDNEKLVGDLNASPYRR